MGRWSVMGKMYKREEGRRTSACKREWWELATENTFVTFWRQDTQKRRKDLARDN